MSVGVLSELQEQKKQSAQISVISVKIVFFINEEISKTEMIFFIVIIPFSK